MQYMLLIYDDEQAWAGMDEAQRGQIFQAYGAYTEDMRQKGVFVAGDVRHQSIKRVASAVGEGAMAVSLIHRYLELL